jgi:hypothetical protein
LYVRMSTYLLNFYGIGMAPTWFGDPYN